MDFVRSPAATTLIALCFGVLGSIAEAQTASSLFLRASTYNGTDIEPSFYNKLDLALSADGIRWQRISTQPALSAFSRDASVVRHNGEYVAVYTDAFNSTNGTFGLARSTNLINWTATNVRLTGPAMTNTPNNTWAPEWFVEDDRYYVLVRSSQTLGNNYGAPGIGYMQCLDPGTWTNWSHFTPLPGLETKENDPFIIKVGATYHLFTDHFDFDSPGNHAILHRKSIESPFAGYGAPANIAANFTNAPAFAASGIAARTAWEGQFVLPLGGNNYRLYFQAALKDACFCIDSTNGMETWELQSMRQLLYDGLEAYGHGSVAAVSSTNSLPSDAVASYVARAEELETKTVSRVQTNPQSYGLYGLADYEANRLAGRADVISDPANFALYTASSIMDLNLGGVMLQKDGTNATVHLEVQSTTDLSQGFTNHPTNISFPVSLPGNKHFLRIRALGPQ